MNTGYIWLIGNKGMLGTEIARQLTDNGLSYIGTDRDVDITSESALESFAKQQESNGHKITWIINCAAYTAVEKAEEDTKLATLLNETGVRNIARTAKKIGATLIHISTDYVFNGTATSPYTETQNKQPLGVYGATKAAGEDAVQETLSDYYIFRTAWLYGFDGKNFVYTMVKLMNTHPRITVVNDQWGTPTFARDLAKMILTVIEQRTNGNAVPSGIYHCTDEGRTTWFDFATAIYQQGKQCGRITSECDVAPCTTAEYGAKVARPAYSVLSKDKIQKTLGIQLPQWQDSLSVFLQSPLFDIK